MAKGRWIRTSLCGCATSLSEFAEDIIDWRPEGCESISPISPPLPLPLSYTCTTTVSGNRPFTVLSLHFLFFHDRHSMLLVLCCWQMPVYPSATLHEASYCLSLSARVWGARGPEWHLCSSRYHPHLTSQCPFSIPNTRMKTMCFHKETSTYHTEICVFIFHLTRSPTPAYSTI